MKGKKAFFMKPKHQCHLSEKREWVYGAQSWKERMLLCGSVLVLIHKWTLTQKNGKKRSFFHETKALMLFIQMRRTRLWRPIMKRKRLLCDLVFVLIDRWSLILKNGRKNNFSYETKASMSFIQMRKMSLWCLILKGMKIIMWVCICFNSQMNFNSKKWSKEKLFLWKYCINVIYPNEENEFMVSNHKKKEDYSVNPCLSQLTKWTLILKNSGKLSFTYEIKASMLLMRMSRISLWCTIMKKSEIITCILFCPN